MKIRTNNPSYEALRDNHPEAMTQGRQFMVHNAVLNTLFHYKPEVAEITAQKNPEAPASYAHDSKTFQQPAVMSIETQTQVTELRQERDSNNQDDLRLAVDLAYENPLYDQKAA